MVEEASGVEISFRAVGQSTLLAFNNTGKLPVIIWDNTFGGDVGRAANGLEDIAKENGVVVDADASRLVAK
jgi:hypothetical protein